MRGHRGLGLLSVFCFLTTTAWAQTQAQDKPPQPKLPPAITSYIAATTSLSAAGQSTLNQLRQSHRLLLLRQLVAEKSATAGPKEAITVPYAFLPQLVCASRKDYYELRSPTETLVALNAPLAALYTNEDEKEPTLRRFLKFLFKGMRGKQGSLPELKGSTVQDVCSDDLSKFEKAVYELPDDFKKADLKTFGIGDALSGLKAVYQVFEPVMSQVLAIAEESERARIVQQYFNKPQSRTQVLKAADAIQKSIAKENDIGRLSALADAAETLAKLSTSKVTKDSLKACEKPAQVTELAAQPAVQLAASSPPAAAADKGPRRPPEQMVCDAAIFAALKDDIKAFLTFAASYDALADVAVANKISQAKTAEGLDGMLKSLGNPKLKFDDLFGWVNAYVNLALEIEKATSKESRKKVKDGIDQMLGRDDKDSEDGKDAKKSAGK